MSLFRSAFCACIVVAKGPSGISGYAYVKVSVVSNSVEPVEPSISIETLRNFVLPAFATIIQEEHYWAEVFIGPL